MDNKRVTDILARYAPISLEQMGAVKLMNRTDTKYVVHGHELLELLAQGCEHYYVQETNGERLMEYHTIYYDTADMAMLRAHTSGRKTRQKIRVRSYVKSALTFVEVKNKNNKGRTKKKRTAIEGANDGTLSAQAAEFVDKNSHYTAASLSASVENRFGRITLVNKEMTERLTIDLGLTLTNRRNGESQMLDHTAIVEVKRDGNAPSHMVEWLKSHKIRKHGFSKYCYGALLTDDSLPLGTMRPKMRHLLRQGLIEKPLGGHHKWVA